ncbi:hypothetical protein, partial [Photobacterium alginatilyticum]
VLLLRFVIVSPVNFRGDDITSNQVAKLTMPLHLLYEEAHKSTFIEESDMSKKITPINNSGNQQNSNKGTPGTNRQYDQAQGNRGKQMNPNQKGNK